MILDADGRTFNTTCQPASDGTATAITTTKTANTSTSRSFTFHEKKRGCHMSADGLDGVVCDEFNDSDDLEVSD